jgi:hypothetical protein
MLGVDRTYDGYHETDAFDPKRTYRNHLAAETVASDAVTLSASSAGILFHSDEGVGRR